MSETRDLTYVTRDLTAKDVTQPVEAAGRWLGRVATIAVGVCLGMIMFALIVRAYVEDKVHNMEHGWTTPTTSTTPTPTFSWSQ
jgi:hypothetical protein